MAHRLGLELAGKGFTVVSGLARGIDCEAHQGALDGGGNPPGNYPPGGYPGNYPPQQSGGFGRGMMGGLLGGIWGGCVYDLESIVRKLNG